MVAPDTETLLEGLAFPETPRWREDRLWFTDQFARQVRTVSVDGTSEVALELDDRTGGLGWMPDGTLLVVAMSQRRLYRAEGGEVELHADLHELASFDCNDMVVDRAGNAYVGNFGYDLHGGAPEAPANLILVSPDGDAEVVAEDLIFPNGSVIEPDGSRLIVAETFASRISAFPIGEDGRLGDRELWAELGEATPDGICLDAEGAVWVASVGTKEVFRVRQGGEELEVLRPRGTPYACMLGGAERTTLFMTTSESDDPSKPELRTGRIEVAQVDVPGAGLP